MQEDVKHIDIPFDELKIFKTVAEEDSYQEVIIETLLLSTLGNVHWGPKVHKTSIFITAKSCWLYKSPSKKYSLPLSHIHTLVKSHGHPELVIMSGEQYDNIRISTSCEDRCWSIISALSYQFTYVQEKYLYLISLTDSNLGYFERSTTDKKNKKDVSLGLYKKQKVTYAKPFRGITDIYGTFPPNKKVILEKQLPIENIEGREDHSIYLARLQDSLMSKSQNPKRSFYEDSPKFISHFVAKRQIYLQQLYEHRNEEFIQKMVYVKASEIKIQVFLEYGVELYGARINAQIFRRMWELYDIGKKIDHKCVITCDSFLIVEKNGMLEPNSSLQVEKQTEQQSEAFDHEREAFEIDMNRKTIVLKEFRYQFLSETEREIELLKYEPLLVEAPETNKLVSKMYTLGCIMYNFCTGKNLFEFEFVENEWCGEETGKVRIMMKLMVEIKKRIEERKTKIFPRYLRMGISKTLQDFILKLLYREFSDERQLFEHDWMSVSKK